MADGTNDVKLTIDGQDINIMPDGESDQYWKYTDTSDGSKVIATIYVRKQG